MTCAHCPHCQELAARADLRLTHPVPRSVPGTIDRAFYLEFAAVYGIARARSTRPVRLLCEVNPELTPSRCKEYLKRARALGVVATPPRGSEPPAVAPAGGSVEVPPVEGAPEPRRRDDPEVVAFLERARAKGYRPDGLDD